MNQIILSSAFQRQLKKIVKQDPRLKEKIAKILKLLLQDINHSSLKLHKLSGENNWSVSVTRDLRIIIHWQNKQVFCLRIGSHNRVY